MSYEIGFSNDMEAVAVYDGNRVVHYEYVDCPECGSPGMLCDCPSPENLDELREEAWQRAREWVENHS